MPYVDNGLRSEVAPPVLELAAIIKQMPSDKRAGVLNYVFTRLIRELYTQRYNEFNEAVGVLECTKHELYRKSVAPYEDSKEKHHGPIEGDL